VRDIRRQRPFTLDELEKIKIFGSQVTVDHVGWPYEPQGLTSAQLNLPFCVATLLLEGDAFVEQFTPEAVHDADRIRLSRKVEVVHDPDITALGSKFRHKVHVEVHLRDGTMLRETREAPRGSEHSFASEADIVEKFRNLTVGILPPTQQEALIEAVLEAEDLPDARRIADLLQAA
jgi:2-methylcitrate dehydratase PrpD